MNYENGKVYKLISDHTDKIYIGSTCQPLSKRKNQHKTNYKKYDDGKHHYITSFELFKLGNVDIILVENYPCKSKEELHARERYWIQQNKFLHVNKVVPTRSHKEYYEENKESIAIRDKNKYGLNKETILAKNKEYREAHKEAISMKNKQYRESNKEDIKKIKKEYYDLKKEDILEKQKYKYLCACGAHIRIHGKARHLRSVKHVSYKNNVST